MEVSTMDDMAFRLSGQQLPTSPPSPACCKRATVGRWITAEGLFTYKKGNRCKLLIFIDRKRQFQSEFRQFQSENRQKQLAILSVYCQCAGSLQSKTKGEYVRKQTKSHRKSRC